MVTRVVRRFRIDVVRQGWEQRTCEACLTVYDVKVEPVIANVASRRKIEGTIAVCDHCSRQEELINVRRRDRKDF